MSPAFEIVAPAKLNLSLGVVGRRADGYHLIDSLVGFCGLADRLRITVTHNHDRVFFEGPFGKDVGVKNTVIAAIRAFRAVRDHGVNISVNVEKNIPIAAGLGGGSANAAGVLRGLRVLTGSIPEKILNDIALSLGADVPACLASAPLKMRGIGESIYLLPGFPPVGVLLVNPLLPLSSRSVFKEFHGPYSVPSTNPVKTLDSAALFHHLGAQARNDLMGPATRQFPVITDILEFLAGLPGTRTVGMSGSGATCFALFPPGDKGAVLAAADAARSRGWWASGTKLLRNGRAASHGSLVPVVT